MKNEAINKVIWDTMYDAVVQTIEECKSATGTHKKIEQFVNAAQIVHDILGTDTTGIQS